MRDPACLVTMTVSHTLSTFNALFNICKCAVEASRMQNTHVCARPAGGERPTFPGAGMCLVALHIFETLYQRQVICLGSLSLSPASLRHISSLHITSAVNYIKSFVMFDVVNTQFDVTVSCI